MSSTCSPPLRSSGAASARAGKLGGHIVWLAVCLYIPYTYFMYAVAPYHDALLLYIAGIGLGTYGLIPRRSR